MLAGLKFTKIQGEVTDVKRVVVNTEIIERSGGGYAENEEALDIFLKNEDGEYFYRVHDLYDEFPIRVGHTLTMVVSSRSGTNKWFVLYVLNNNLKTGYFTIGKTVKSGLRYTTLGKIGNESVSDIVVSLLIFPGILSALFVGISKPDDYAPLRALLVFLPFLLIVIFHFRSKNKFGKALKRKAQSIIENKE